ncbi:hypothetical protein CANCADRAFT_2807 [Tortispora caseinolytica NRRL Y-17796]|uniref:Peptidase M20 dimerisation domain-containing protein n=1 Tax=Tortispora caseinolytica NRRL Y-17796 TaxID=767744 RepID=A0A1E4TH67_9ASCO|nr:hypothetical protein CANCADRAFT_2807 [Tortispora caseinolytica NRRL Y-17796]
MIPRVLTPLPAEACSSDTPHRVSTWNHNSSILSLAYTDSYVFAGCQTGEIHVLDLHSYSSVATLRGHTSSVHSLCINNSYLISGSSDSLIMIWNIATLTLEYTVYSIFDIGDIFAICPIGEYIYFGSQNASIQWFSISRPSYKISSLPALRYDKFFDSKCFHAAKNPTSEPSSDNSEPSLQANTIEVPPSNISRYAHYSYIYDLTYAQLPSGINYLISAGGDGYANIWSVSDSNNIKLLHSLACSDTASVSALAVYNQFLYCATGNGQVKVWDLTTMQPTRSVQVDAEEITSLSIDAKYICAASTSGNISFWNHRFELLAKWQAHKGRILASLFLNFPRPLLVTGSSDASVALWDISVFIPENRQPHVGSTCKPNFQNDDLLHAVKKLVSYRTVSSMPSLYIEECSNCAFYLYDMFKRMGVYSSLLPVKSANPLVLGKFTVEKPRRRVLFYGHYDVVPADNLDWNSDPYDLEASDGYIYGRGVSDNKGPLLAAIFAAHDIYTRGELDIDVIFLLEGEEECASRGLEFALSEHADSIGAIDLIFVSNSTWINETTPCINFGLRGVLNATITISSDRPDLHSGVDGGAFREPAQDLIQLLSALANDTGQVQIPGFYDNVRPATDAELTLYDDICKCVPELSLEQLQARWRQPSFSIYRLVTGNANTGGIIPRQVQAFVSFRLVPDQDLDSIKRILKEFLDNKFRAITKSISQCALKVEFTREASPWMGNFSDPIYSDIKGILRDIWHEEPLFIREGGSITALKMLETAFNAPVIQIPCGQSSDNAHLGNERLRLINLFNLRTLFKRLFTDLKTSAQ